MAIAVNMAWLGGLFVAVTLGGWGLWSLLGWLSRRRQRRRWMRDAGPGKPRHTIDRLRREGL